MSARRLGRATLLLVAAASLALAPAAGFARGGSGGETPTAVIKRVFRRGHGGAQLLGVYRNALLGPRYAGVVFRPRGTKGFARIELAVYRGTHLVADPTAGENGLLSPSARWQIRETGTGTFETKRLTSTLPEEAGEPPTTSRTDTRGTFEWTWEYGYDRKPELFDLGVEDGFGLPGRLTVSGSGTSSYELSTDPSQTSTCSFTVAPTTGPTQGVYNSTTKAAAKHGRPEVVAGSLGDLASIHGDGPGGCPGGLPELADSAEPLAFSIEVPESPWTSPVSAAVHSSYHRTTTNNAPPETEKTEGSLTTDGHATMTMDGF